MTSSPESSPPISAYRAAPTAWTHATDSGSCPRPAMSPFANPEEAATQADVSAEQQQQSGSSSGPMPAASPFANTILPAFSKVDSRMTLPTRSTGASRLNFFQRLFRVEGHLS